jgi:hypothetical protein
MNPLSVFLRQYATPLLVVLGIALFSAGSWLGYRWEHTKLIELEAELAQEAEKAQENYRNLERKNVKDILHLADEFNQKDLDARERDAAVIADLRSGNQRLRLQVKNCSRATKGGASAEGVDGGGTAELAPEAAATLWGIAGDGDRAVRKLTALQQYVLTILPICGAAP